MHSAKKNIYTWNIREFSKYARYQQEIEPQLANVHDDGGHGEVHHKKREVTCISLKEKRTKLYLSWGWGRARLYICCLVHRVKSE